MSQREDECCDWFWHWFQCMAHLWLGIEIGVCKDNWGWWAAYLLVRSQKEMPGWRALHLAPGHSYSLTPKSEWGLFVRWFYQQGWLESLCSADGVQFATSVLQQSLQHHLHQHFGGRIAYCRETEGERDCEKSGEGKFGGRRVHKYDSFCIPERNEVRSKGKRRKRGGGVYQRLKKRERGNYR